MYLEHIIHISDNILDIRVYYPFMSTSKYDDEESDSNNIASHRDRMYPAMVFVHSGGCLQLSVEFYDHILRYLANSSGLILVDYLVIEIPCE